MGFRRDFGPPGVEWKGFRGPAPAWRELPLSDHLQQRDRVRVIFWTQLDESRSAPAMAVVEIHRHRFTVEDFAHMGEAGIFAAEDRVELIDGEIREMAPIGPPHAAIVDRLAELLLVRLAGKANEEQLGKSIHDRRMGRADRGHFAYLSVDQLHTVFRREDPRLAHVREVLDGEAVTVDFNYGHGGCRSGFVELRPEYHAYAVTLLQVVGQRQFPPSGSRPSKSLPFDARRAEIAPKSHRGTASPGVGGNRWSDRMSSP